MPLKNSVEGVSSMFIWLNKQGVRSDEGFEFQFTERFSAEYRENGRVTSIYVEPGMGVVTIYEGSIRSLWNNIRDGETKRLERNRIIINITSALIFQGLEIDLAQGMPPAYYVFN